MSSSNNLENKNATFLNKSNSGFIEEMYVKFINKDPSLSESWIEYFSSVDEDMKILVDEINGPSWKPFSKKIHIEDVEKTAKENEKIKDNSSTVSYTHLTLPTMIRV